jgi:hypothetical protein
MKKGTVSMISLVDPHWTITLCKEKFSPLNKNRACSELSHILFLSAATLNIFLVINAEECNCKK